MEFAALAMEMFPGRGHFLAFLEERHFEQQVETAKHILLRLAYQARVSPPNKFLYNLLDAESRLAGTAGKAPFNGRDHFVHLVNLYLLGLYVFWYHGHTHKRVREQFHDLANNPDDYSQQEENISACQGFLVAWREFVLFHDLGYPWEISLGLENALNFLMPFSEIPRYVAKDSALFAISQLLALEWLRREEQVVLLENSLRTYLATTTPRQVNMFTAPEHLREAWGKSEKLPVLADGALWRLVREIVPKEDRFSILETATDGRPIASTNPDLQTLFTGTRASLESELTDREWLARWANRNTLPARLRDHYQWVHYSRNYAQHFWQFIERLFPQSGAQPSEFSKFIHDFLDGFPPTQSASEDSQFDDYAYAMFRRLLESLDFDSFDQEGRKRLVIHDTISQFELRGLQGRFLKEIGGSLLSRLEKRASLMEDKEQKNIVTMPLDEYLRELLSELRQTSAVAAEVESQLSDQIKTRVELKRRLYNYYDLLKKQVMPNVEKSIPEVFPKVDTSKKNPSISGLDWSAFKQNSLAEELDALLGDRRLGGIPTLESYFPVWGPKQNFGAVFADHGLASGLLYAQVRQVWQAALRDTTSALGRLLNLRGANEEVMKPINPSHSAVHEVLYSILLHNLYPNSFKEGEHQKFRSKPEKREAFTYFALLCDSLQPWDRKRLFSQATGSLPYTTYAENFDVEVEGIFLRITERGEQLRIDERQAALRTYLSSYLERASDLVKLHLSEWR